MFFFDSYAIIELLEGNTSYSKYSGEQLITSSLNLAEVYYYYLKLRKGPDFLRCIQAGKIEIIPVNLDDSLSAMRFKHDHRSQKFSFVDCIGYSLAISKELRFLTGDKEFEGLPQVEYVK